MLLAMITLAAVPDLVPARWDSDDAKSLELLKDTPVNCLLLEEKHWKPQFLKAAGQAGVSAYAVIRPGAEAASSAQRAAGLGFRGVAFEGAFEPRALASLRKLALDSSLKTVELPPRSGMRFDLPDEVVGTNQGLWPGVRPHDSNAKTGPTAAAWIDTNTGFLRYAREASKATIWIANRPPPGQVFTFERYIQAAADAALSGARWVIALDEETNARLLAGDKSALAGWQRLCGTIRFYEEHKDWRSASPFARLALVENADSGALLSGGVLDMIAVKHTPVRPVPVAKLAPALMVGAQLAVNVDPAALGENQQEVLRAFTRAGGTLLTGPPGWRFPSPRPGQITLEKDELGKLDEIWRDLNALTGRKNLGARLFNVSTMLSNLLESADRSQVILHLVNYSDYPVENVTVHVLGKYRSAALLQPGSAPSVMAGYEVDEGTGYDIDKVGPVATLVLTR